MIDAFRLNLLALGALTRSEPFLLFFFLLTPLVMFHPRLEWKQRFGYTAVAALVAMLTLAPWVGRNLTTFDDPTFLAVGPGYVLEIANCDLAYSGTFLGYWHDSCGSNWPDDPDADGDVSECCAERGTKAGTDCDADTRRVQ